MSVHKAELAKSGDTTISDDTDVGPWTVLAHRNSSCAAAIRQRKAYGWSTISTPLAASASPHDYHVRRERNFSF